jgi:hypothetical protein
MSKPYCKLAVSNIQNNKIKEARRIALMYCRRYGFRAMLFLIFVTTFSGLEMSKKLPVIYEKWLEIRTGILIRLRFT